MLSYKTQNSPKTLRCIRISWKWSVNLTGRWWGRKWKFKMLWVERPMYVSSVLSIFRFLFYTEMLISTLLLFFIDDAHTEGILEPYSIWSTVAKFRRDSACCKFWNWRGNPSLGVQSWRKALGGSCMKDLRAYHIHFWWTIGVKSKTQR